MFCLEVNLEQISMQDDSEATVVRIANDIRQYLADHPNAADTADGIAKWWFLRQRFEESSLLVQKALDYLVSESLVERKANLGSDHVYFNLQESVTIKHNIKKIHLE